MFDPSGFGSFVDVDGGQSLGGGFKRELVERLDRVGGITWQRVFILDDGFLQTEPGEFRIKELDVVANHFDDVLLHGEEVDLLVHDGPHPFLGMAAVDYEVVALVDVLAGDLACVGGTPGDRVKVTAGFASGEIEHQVGAFFGHLVRLLSVDVGRVGCVYLGGSCEFLL